ncbi:hypothetical protein [Pedobacter aquatilis]|uniref:hypothetical protein n=1 Tax=Pedobacter aquatilis TaxID=351343 RepID=UPI00292DB736|nr:hypothetical protein [Pedobacter aquatilis]
MKKLLFMGMMCLLSVGVSVTSYAYYMCTAHLIVVDADGDVVARQDFTADTCVNAVKGAKWVYWMNTGDTSIF